MVVEETLLSIEGYQQGREIKVKTKVKTKVKMKVKMKLEIKAQKGSDQKEQQYLALVVSYELFEQSRLLTIRQLSVA